MNIDNKIAGQARGADMIAFFEKHCGITFAQRHGAYRCKQHPSLAVKGDRRSWYWHSKGIGGCGPLDYLMKIENLPFREAAKTAAGASPALPAAPRQKAEPPKMLSLPPKNDTSLRLCDYLCNKRGIDGRIVLALIQRELLYEDSRGNAVFVGFDEHGRPRSASIRGTYGSRPFRMDCAGSDKRHAFCIESPRSDKLYIHESAIDAMSKASLENIFSNDMDAWNRHSYLSLAGTSDMALTFFLNKRPAVKELVFCLDNDPAGRKAAAAMSKKFESMGFFVRNELPFAKDCNEDLLIMLREGALC